MIQDGKEQPEFDCSAVGFTDGLMACVGSMVEVDFVIAFQSVNDLEMVR